MTAYQVFQGHLQPVERINKFGRAFVGKNEQEIYEMITSQGKISANQQYGTITIAEEYLKRQGGRFGMTDLANSIIAGQAEKLAKYGPKTFPMSDKQTEIIARVLWNNFRHIEIA